jgi:beta-xylosidase
MHRSWAFLVLSTGWLGASACSSEPRDDGRADAGAPAGGSAGAGGANPSAGRAGSGSAGAPRAGASGSTGAGGTTAAGGAQQGGAGPNAGTAGAANAGRSGDGGIGAASGAGAGNGMGGSNAGSGGLAAGSGGASATGGSGGVSGPWPPSATFQNPVLWQDLADVEVIRVDDTFYYTASNMHYSPGAPILRSYDLVNWEYAGHAVPVLDFATKYDLNGGHAYVKGTWASTLQYRKSNETFYWLGCIEFGRTYVYTAKAVEGPWEKHPAINNCYYDAGILVDDDDTIYVAYGNTDISVAELSADGFSQVRAEQVYSATDMTLEGARFFKRDGDYYILLTRPADGQFILRSSSPWGPYTRRTLIDRNRAPIQGGGVPHQGGFVDTANGDWYYMSFIDAYPGGRIPALAPVTWSEDGWPSIELVNGEWGATYPYPDVPRPPRETRPHTGTKTFEGPTLAHEWEWNHNPDNTKWSFDGGLRLATATVTNDLYRARNTLTHRILGPESTGTIELDLSEMQDGDVAGLALLRQSSAYIAVRKTGDTARIVMVGGLAMDGSWNTTSTGTEAASAALSQERAWLRLSVDVRPGSGRQGRFSYSTDGTTFTPLGNAHTMDNTWQFFMGYRYGIFNFATDATGGAVTVRSFTLTTP